MCKYCTFKDKDGQGIDNDELASVQTEYGQMYGSSTALITDENELRFSFCLCDVDILDYKLKIKYCPMCGRNLATDSEVDDGK